MAWVLRCSGSHKTIVKEVSPEVGDPFSSSRGGFPPAVELMQACIFKASKRESLLLWLSKLREDLNQLPWV